LRRTVRCSGLQRKERALGYVAQVLCQSTHFTKRLK
jgi:hypothetical protein